MSIEENIKKLNLLLPEAPDPVGSYVAAKIAGNLLYISGQVSIDEKGKFIKGKLGKNIDVDKGYKAAERCAINIIAQAKKACGNDLSKIKSCVKLTGYVNSSEDFIDQPKVINGCSDLLIEYFGEKGKHARSAVGVYVLPNNIPVEIEAIIEIKT